LFLGRLVETGKPKLALVIPSHRNLKTRSKIKPWKVKNGEKSAQGMNNTYIEYCAMENLGGKIQFMI
jgi:hypothetical protein